MTSAALARFRARVREQMEKFSPATFEIAAQTYIGATSGWSGRDPLGEGGSKAERRISFWLPMKSFTDAGQKPPRGGTARLVCQQPAAFAGTYLIDDVLIDGTGTTAVLRCIQKPQ